MNANSVYLTAKNRTTKVDQAFKLLCYSLLERVGELNWNNSVYILVQEPNMPC